MGTVCPECGAEADESIRRLQISHDRRGDPRRWPLITVALVLAYIVVSSFVIAGWPIALWVIAPVFVAWSLLGALILFAWGRFRACPARSATVLTFAVLTLAGTFSGQIVAFSRDHDREGTLLAISIATAMVAASVATGIGLCLAVVRAVAVPR